MQRPSIAQTVYKLAIAGEQAGFSLEQMIQMLNAGVTVESLLYLIEWRLADVDPTGTSLFFSLDHVAPRFSRAGGIRRRSSQ
jgi:hypothetical protein